MNDVNQVRVILQQPAVVLNQSEIPIQKVAEASITASYALFAETTQTILVTSASQAETADFALNAASASFAQNAENSISSSQSETADFAISSSFSDIAVSASYTERSATASLAELALSSSAAIISLFANSSNTATSASYSSVTDLARLAISASFVGTASFVTNNGQLENTFFVTQEGNDANDGLTMETAFRTIKRASLAVIAYVSASASVSPIPRRSTIRVSPGYYVEEAPIILPNFTSIVGNDLRTAVVRPTNATRKENLFLMNNACYAYGLRLEGAEIDNLYDPRTGFFFAFQPGAYIVTSPYIQNCTAAHVPFDKFYVPLEPIPENSQSVQPNSVVGNGPGGMIVDDSVLDPYSPLKSMVVDAYTQVAFNGVGLVVRGAGYAQQVSFFTNFSHVGTWAIGGGHASLLNSNTTFGDYGLRSSGKRILVVPNIESVSTHSSAVDSSLILSQKNNIIDYVIEKLQLSGSYSASYLDTDSTIHKSTRKDAGILVDSITSDLLGDVPGRTVQFTQGLFKGQDVSSGSIYTLPTASGFDKAPVAAFRINDIFRYNVGKCKRDIGYIIDAYATDILYGGNQRAIEAGTSYYLYPSLATTTQLTKTLEGISYAGTLAENALSGSAGDSQLSKLISGSDIVLNIVEFGTGSAPTLIRNGAEAIRRTVTPQVTSSTVFSSSIITTSNEGFATVYNIINTGTGSFPTLIPNTVNNIKVTAGSQYFGVSPATVAETSSLSSSIAVVTRIITRGLGAVPALTSSVANNIKVTGVVQYTGSSAATISQSLAISSSIRLVNRIIRNGTGSLPAIIPYTTPSSDSNVLAAYDILKNNITFIQEETIAYLSSSWSTFSYDEVKCKRDIGYIISGAAEDLLYGSNSSSINNGIHYYLFPSEATGSQLNQTIDGIDYASRLAQKLVLNTIFVTASADKLQAYDIVFNNKNLIADEVVAYISSSWSTASYDEVKCKRDVGYILDAAATDLVYGGNQRSIEAGRYYFLYPSDATTTQVNFTVDGINHASRLVQQLVLNTPLISPTQHSLDARELILSNKQFIADEVVSYVSASWSTASYDEIKCKRDVGYILDSIVTDIVYGGNQRSIEAGRYYYLYPSQATGAQKDFTLSAIEYARQTTENVLQNIVFVNPPADRLAAFDLLRSNRSAIQEATIEKLNTALVFDFIRAWKYIREFIVDDPANVFGSLSLLTKQKVTQLTNIPIDTIYKTVFELSPELLQVFGSLITSTSHDFSYAGAGANFLALPANQGGIGVTDFALRVFQEDDGRVYHTSGDETGDFYAGNDFIIRQETGTIEGRTFIKAILATFTPLNLALENL